MYEDATKALARKNQTKKATKKKPVHAVRQAIEVDGKVHEA
jgi:hypothetical protein